MCAVKVCVSLDIWIGQLAFFLYLLEDKKYSWWIVASRVHHINLGHHNGGVRMHAGHNAFPTEPDTFLWYFFTVSEKTGRKLFVCHVFYHFLAYPSKAKREIADHHKLHIIEISHLDFFVRQRWLQHAGLQ